MSEPAATQNPTVPCRVIRVPWVTAMAAVGMVISVVCILVVTVDGVRRGYAGWASAPIILPLMWGLWRDGSARVEACPEEVRVVNAVGRRWVLRWDAIERFELDPERPSSGYCVACDGRRYPISVLASWRGRRAQGWTWPAEQVTQLNAMLITHRRQASGG